MSRSQPVKNFLTITEAAKKIGISRQAVWEAVKRDRIEAVKVGNVCLLNARSVQEYRKARDQARDPFFLA